MSFKTYQKQVDKWVSQFKTGYFPPMVMLMEEVGELAREANHKFGIKKGSTRKTTGT